MHRSGVHSRIYDKSEIDHHWGSVKEKTPFNFAVHKLLHLSNPHHRSWQTHSLLVTGGACFLLWSLVNFWVALYGNTFTLVFLRLCSIGLIVGVLSHLILDVLTTAGIHTIPGKKIRLVPKSSTFATGTKWEGIVFKLLMLGILCILCYEIYTIIS